MTPKQRMLAAYRGHEVDRPPVAPELWVYYPAKLMGVDLVEFEREVPFHEALKQAFEHVGCEGWGVAFARPSHPQVEHSTEEAWIDEDTLEVHSTTRLDGRELHARQRYSRREPSWVVERPVKDFRADMAVIERSTFEADLPGMDCTSMVEAWQHVGESYLLEGWLGVPFFDWVASHREGGLQQAVFDFVEHEAYLEGVQRRYVEYLERLIDRLCEATPMESFCIGCSWSCNSLIGPTMWRRWDKPVIAAAARRLHERGRLLHVHFHGRCMETVEDFAEIGIDCVCPFERPPGGDVEGIEGLREVRRKLDDRVTFNGNVHTVETLIRGTPEDVRREVRQVLEAFDGTSRVIVGTGDQVGRETPEANLRAMVGEVTEGLSC